MHLDVASRLCVFLTAVVVLAAGCTSSSTTPLVSSRHGNRQSSSAPVSRQASVASRVMWRSPYVTLRYPSRWVRTIYDGAPATVVNPIVYLSERHLGGPCPPQGRGPSDRPGPTTCFNGSWQVPDDAAIIRWTFIEIPSAIEYRIQPGRHLRIDHLPAKLFMSRKGCEGVPGATIRAAIKRSTQPYDYSFLAMNACVGRHAPPGDISAIEAMIRTAKVNRG